MSKAAIRELKARRFWRWLCVEVYGKPAPRQPIKRNTHRLKRRLRNFARSWKNGFEQEFRKDRP